jgi:hypothetical protein
MEWRSSCEIEIADLGDRLEVLARTQRGALSWLLSALVVSGVAYLFATGSQVMALLVAAVAGFSFLNSLRKGNETRLIARSDGFIAEGNINRTFAHQVTVSVHDIHSIGYSVGPEEAPSGLYAFSRWRQTCLVPGLDEASCSRIQSAIEAKFPQMQFGQEQVASLFGNGPEIITLGLKQDNEDGSRNVV